MAAEKIYSSLLASLLPPGPAWTTEPGSNLTKLLKGLGEELERVDNQAGGLVLEANPLSMSTMLDVRYQEAGLPDLCKGKPAEDSEQQKEVVGKWSARGGQSIAYFYEVAEKYGFDIIIDEYAIFKIEHQGIETLGIDSEYAYSWSINYVDGQQIYFRAGENKADDRLEIAKGIGINCIFGKLKPAHTSIIYTAWDSAIDMLFRPLINYNFQDMAETLPSSISFGRSGSGATRIDSQGIIVAASENEPRFDYDPVLLYCKGLLCEGTSTNYCIQNRNITVADCIKTGGSAYTGDVLPLNPAGNAPTNQTFLEDSSTGVHTLDYCVGLAIDTSLVFTFSVYVYTSARPKFRLSIIDADPANSVYADFDLVAQTAVAGNDGFGDFSPVARIENFRDGWYRCSVTGSPNIIGSLSTLTSCKIALKDSGGNLSYTGDGISRFYVWGSQMEQMEFPTSLIRTVASVSTRGADLANIASDALWWASKSAGTFAITGFRNYQTVTEGIMFLLAFDGGDTHKLTSDADWFTYEVKSGGVTQASLSSDHYTLGSPFRMACAYAENDFAIAVNGGNCVKDISGVIPVVANYASLAFGQDINGHITQFVFYGDRLDDIYLTEISAIG